jgi:dTDP-4-dehydrorhamnose 3,5-epimerase
MWSGKRAGGRSTLDIADVRLTPLKRIPSASGEVLHAMKVDDPGFARFGEAYFSTIEPGAVKAWKRHHKMILNLVVPIGSIRFVIHDDREGSSTYGVFDEVVLSKDYYYRLTIPPMLWMGFQCVGKVAGILLNVANIPHDPNEVDRKEIDEFDFDWRMKP